MATAKLRDAWRDGVDLGPIITNVTVGSLGQRVHLGGTSAIDLFAPLLSDAGLRSSTSTYPFDIHITGKLVVQKLKGKLRYCFRQNVRSLDSCICSYVNGRY
jgi:hypothetical protein